jgi:uncharacterized protein YecE (DUF72 family)
MAQGPGRINIGISGWRYGPWRGVFYPPDLPQTRELEFAARCFPTVEINGSFYSLQRPEFYRRWYDAAPAEFRFAVKGSRYITHMLRLRGVERALANFYASGVLALEDKLGPFLWQFPPNFRFESGRFASFLALLPRDTHAALALARRRDRRMRGRSWLRAGARRPLQHAVEIRHETFLAEEFVTLLRRERVALVIADTAGKWPYAEDVTAPFMYLRLHGDKEIYASGYTTAALRRWAQRIEAWSRGGEIEAARKISRRPPVARARRDVYCYFDNDIKVHAPYDALVLARMLRARLGALVPGQPPAECFNSKRARR